jgi:hypothetical protein
MNLVLLIFQLPPFFHPFPRELIGAWRELIHQLPFPIQRNRQKNSTPCIFPFPLTNYLQQTHGEGIVFLGWVLLGM